MTRCPYCGALVECRPCTIAIAQHPHLQVLGDAGWCGCGLLVLTPCARLALDELARCIAESASSNHDRSTRQHGRLDADATKEEA
jgi:hypothetical protein